MCDIDENWKSIPWDEMSRPVGRPATPPFVTLCPLYAINHDHAFVDQIFKGNNKSEFRHIDCIKKGYIILLYNSYILFANHIAPWKNAKI